VWFLVATPDVLIPEARRLLARALALEPEHRHARAHRALIRFFYDGRYQDAIDDWAELLFQFPNDTDPLRYYSHALQAIGRPDLALRVLNHLIELDPFEPRAFEARGQIYFEDGLYEQARLDFERALTMGRCCYWNLVALAARQGDMETMARHLPEVQLWQPRAYPLFNGLYSLLKGDVGKAEDILMAIINSEGDTQWGMKSQAAGLLEDVDRAVQYYEKALTNRDPYVLMSVHYRSQGLGPAFYRHPGFEQAVRDAGLDAASVARLTVPALPF
jgi:tetratricopeptide (TPR) repeat protein